MKKEDLIKKYVFQNRKKATIYERLMLLKLKANRIKFVFQYPIDYKDSFIICDFYLPKYNAIIEVDGMYHDELLQTYKDIERDKFLSDSGYNVFRMFNNEIDCFDTSKLKELPEYMPKQTNPKKKRPEYKTKKQIRDEKFGSKFSAINPK